jgi:uncharacterized protein YciI
VKVVNHASYVSDGDKVSKHRPAHRVYMGELFAAGRLVAGGPFDDGSGALFIYQVESLAEAEDIVAADPYTTSGTFARSELKAWEVVLSNPDLLI